MKLIKALKLAVVLAGPWMKAAASAEASGHPESPSSSHAHQHLRQLRNVNAVQSANGVRVDIDTDKGMDGADEGGGQYVLLYRVAPGFHIQVKSNPRSGEIQIRPLGNPNQILNAEEKGTLVAIAEALEAAGDIATDEVDQVGTQGARAARVLSEWPDVLGLEFDYDATVDSSDEGPRAQPDAAPEVPGNGKTRRAVAIEEGKPEESESSPSTSHHHYRRLAYTSICPYVNSFVQVTHDDWDYDRWDDRTTYYAYISMHASGPCSGGTYFWTGTAWSCYEPDHDPNVEYAYGDCFGRCGEGCGSGTQFTLDCADHDSCVRFGHDILSLWCSDEFQATVDDALFAPNCF
ncbi:expressed unknown protein [Seminavis robusta]|uniref:Uncharacterized protein n=1 Tax=Seminavis robusta TaxID=568900 RepID=A0A9N8ELB0_9STRA|nr:expressed unknown protein [Seminavis robusta]|eukprot:Sro1189_g250670.1 n/a (348) ;mRNA; f:5958-7001